MTRPAIFYLLLAALAGLTIVGSLVLSSRNQMDPSFGDGESYRLLSSEFSDAAAPFGTDGVRNELYTFLSRAFVGTVPGKFFSQIRVFNSCLAGASVLLLGAAFLATLHPVDAILLAWFAALGLLIPLTQYVAAENIFLTLFALSSVLGALALRGGDLRYAAATGLVTGLAYLAKPSVAPALGIFLVCITLRCLSLELRRAGKSGAMGAVARAGVPALAALVATLLVVSPRLAYAYGRYDGQFSYNHSSHVFWVENWEKCTRYYMDCSPAALARMSPEALPTAENYLRRNGFNHCVKRLFSGVYLRLRQLVLPANPASFLRSELFGTERSTVLPVRELLILGFLAAPILAVLAAKNVRAAESLLWPGVFVALLSAAYLFAYAWYFPIASGYRFTNTLILPICWLALYAGKSLDGVRCHWPAGRPGRALRLVICALLLASTGLLLFDPRPYRVVWQTF